MPRIVHIGLGNFHRAHQAWYTSQLADWQITGVIMSNRTLRDDLIQCENRFGLGIWSKDGLSAEEISIFDNVLLAKDEAAEISACIANPDTQVITLTVTEKGYHLQSNGAGLDLTAEPIAADLKSGHPSTAIGLLAEGLALRCKPGGLPITVVCCDNLADNGEKLKLALLDYISVRSPSAISFIEANVTFPNTMVDRITPKLTSQAKAEIAKLLPDTRLPLVGTEAFSEWIIEDKFAGARPDWDQAGAIFVSDVTSFEQRKLRMLNATHSFLAYAGINAGYDYVHEAIADPKLFGEVQRLWDEVQSTISAPASETLPDYRKALLDRFSVPELRHKLEQIAMDGSLKIRERILPTLVERAKEGRSTHSLIRVIVVWLEFIQRELATAQSPNDPLFETFEPQFSKDRFNEENIRHVLNAAGVPILFHNEIFRCFKDRAIG